MKTTLDRETTASYSISIIATDDGTDPSANQATLNLGKSTHLRCNAPVDENIECLTCAKLSKRIIYSDKCEILFYDVYSVANPVFKKKKLALYFILFYFENEADRRFHNLKSFEQCAIGKFIPTKRFIGWRCQTFLSFMLVFYPSVTLYRLSYHGD